MYLLLSRIQIFYMHLLNELNFKLPYNDEINENNDKYQTSSFICLL